ncbi:hypothetical protein V1292_005727 [Bradyrhizobium sp. AZCC 1719]
MRLRSLANPDLLPALDKRYALQRPETDLGGGPQYPPRILLLYGSLRERSYSRFVVEEAARLLRFFGAEPRIFDPSDLPLPDQVRADNHPLSTSCASSPCGRKDRSGAARSATARSPAS